MKISNYFKYAETIVTDTKLENIPNDTELENIIYAGARLDLIRREVHTPIYINSWFRSDGVNKKVGGVANSSHRLGLAIDFHTGNVDIELIYDRLVNLCKTERISYDQLILYPKKGFIHIGFKNNISQERKEAFTK